MDQPISYYRRLIHDYINGRLTAEACEELFAFAQTQNGLFVQLLEEDELHDLVLETIDVRSVDDNVSERIHARLLTSINEQTREEVETPQSTGPVPVRKIAWLRYAAAAAIIIMMGIGAYWWISSTKKTPETARVQPVQNDVPPGGNKAILTLADNSTIVLDSAANGKLAEQGSSVVNKTKDGQLEYQSATGNRQLAITYNMLSTPRGGQYQLMLPDGSKVWLNAASSIRYPTAFTGNERSVQISGEAYFEVAKDAKKPFRVHFASAGREGAIEVLGTHFNINAYDDEPAIKTTLLEGAVRVTKGEASADLKPGEQVSISQSSQPSQPIPVQTEEVVAWKNGKLSFNHLDMQSIMRQAARWYDLEVIYKDKIEDTYTVSVPRNVPVSQLLQALEMSSGVHFIIEGKKVTVTK